MFTVQDKLTFSYLIKMQKLLQFFQIIIEIYRNETFEEGQEVQADVENVKL